MEIQTIPGYEADEITVVYRRKPDGSKAIRVLPAEESQKLLAKRNYRSSGRLKSDGEYVCPFCERKFETPNGNFTHQQWCEKNPNKSAKRPRGESLAADPAAARKFIEDLLKRPYCGKKCKNGRGLGVHKASCDKNPDKKTPSEGLRTPAPQWSDEGDLYLADHFKDPILSLLEHFNLPEREIRQRIGHLKKTGLIKEVEHSNRISPGNLARANENIHEHLGLAATGPIREKDDVFSIPGHMKKMIGTMFNRPPEDNTPVEVGAKVWDFKYHEGTVVTVDLERKVCTVEFPSINEARKFNFEGTRKMIKEYERRSQPHNDGIGVDH
ncbi:hypothetical protein M0R72_11310 [Candidatus Pacearchaeota archaeon]|jgi:hypothetical protein|nr:hypothetical protein [Candidatus Pacearchaeota archaeon]